MKSLNSSSNPIDGIEVWFKSQCDGDWEHSYGLLIETTDNPGWHVEIDLTDTEWDEVIIPFSREEVSESDWIQFEVRDGKFTGAGSVAKLNQILFRFLKLVESDPGAGSDLAM